MDCEVCGSRNAFRRAKIEGAILTVCDSCVMNGEELARVEVVRRPALKFQAPKEIDYALKDSFSSIVKKNREKMGLTQEQLAYKIKESHTVVKRIEEGWEPPLPIIKKLERFLNVSLMSASMESDYKLKVKQEGLTLGDIASINKK